ncbi:arginase family protein [Salinicola rhizosphaerae]|uniref:Arginase n=1 Tax=Salinicola rhizosphaerae TaxID=1443141 RepID=A0ABQ3ELQ8_9GAMM|nr:arginase family protein [Salinicola rhizosphaerae]GHB34598.1 arginase [Salinicola rhizosphaerae]
MSHSNRTLRLLFPQWQGGNNPAYIFGAKLLDYLSPASTGPREVINVDAPTDDELPLENGIRGRQALLRQLSDAEDAIARHQPERLVVLGGDCLVDLAPFAYLNERYNGELGVLWIDAHPDVMTPKEFDHAHAMVLGNLIGEGDDDFRRHVKTPLKPENVMIAGLGATLPSESEFLDKHGVSSMGPAEIGDDSMAIIDWIEARGIRHLAIHFDLDVLDPSHFRSVLFADPTAPIGSFDGITQGDMNLNSVLRLITDVDTKTDIVGLGITEHLPWDAINLSSVLAKLPLLRSSPSA